VHKQILGYLPANLVPAAVSFLMIYAYTRVLTPGSFGAYSFVFSVVAFVQSSVYDAIPMAVMRFYPASAVAGRKTAFLREASALFYAVALGIVALGGIALWLIPLRPDEVSFVWMGLPLLVLRSAVGMNQAVNRSSNLMARFNWIECAHAVLGLGLGLLFILLLGPTAKAVILGLLVAALICTLTDSRLMVASFPFRAGWVDSTEIMRIVNFVWPLVVAALTASLLQLSDRFVVGGLGSAEMLGLYTVAYSLVERPTNLICTSISTATFSMAVQALEQHGLQAGSIQAGKNGAALLALSLPACVGLAMTSHSIATVVVGSAYQAGVAALIPIMCFTALFRGVRAHFVDHAFHLARRPRLLLWSYAPAAAANIMLNLVLVPRYGMMGAAWSALVCQAGATTASWFIGRRVFPLWLPAGPVLGIFGAVISMAIVLWVVEFPGTWLGLIGAVVLGLAVYGFVSLLLNVGGIRSFVRVRLA
jgi:O-antigen/teichoic acid export membrane protein